MAAAGPDEVALYRAACSDLAKWWRSIKELLASRQAVPVTTKGASGAEHSRYRLMASAGIAENVICSSLWLVCQY